MIIMRFVRSMALVWLLRFFNVSNVDEVSEVFWISQRSEISENIVVTEVSGGIELLTLVRLTKISRLI